MNQIPAHYSTEDVSAVERIVKWLESPGHTQAALALAAGLSAGTVNRILRGTWPSAPTPHLEAMAAALERAAERAEERTEIPFVETSISELMRRVCRRAHNDRDFEFFAGRVGLGKTVALKRYQAENRGATVLLEAYPGAGAPVVLRLLADAVGALPRRRTIAETMVAVVEQLRGSDRVVLVDEAETLTDQALLHLRRISDTAGVGVVLAGTPKLLSLVIDPDGRFGQIHSRIGFWPAIQQSISEADATALARSFLVDEPPAGVQGALWDECEGSARTLRNLLRNTSRYCARRGVPMSAEVVRQTARHTMGGRRLA